MADPRLSLAVTRLPPTILGKLSPTTFFISGQTQPENTEKHKPNLKNRF
jgi:hypothetical protein